MTPDAENMISLLRRVVPVTSRLIAAVPTDAWSAPTPCEDMTTLELVGHIVAAIEQFTDVAEGMPLDPSAQRPLTAEDARQEFDAASERALASWSAPGVGDRLYDMPWGEEPGARLIGFLVIEELGHGWDLARATDQDPAFADDVVIATLDMARAYDDESIRVPEMFGPVVEIADDARPIDRLAAYLGRRPQDWGG